MRLKTEFTKLFNDQTVLSGIALACVMGLQNIILPLGIAQTEAVLAISQATEGKQNPSTSPSADTQIIRESLKDQSEAIQKQPEISVPSTAIPIDLQNSPALTQPPPPPSTGNKKELSVPKVSQSQPIDTNPRAILKALVDQGIFPSDTVTKKSISRAEMAYILLKALNLNTDLVSEFPFYRDVPLEHWAYRPIELARQERFIRYDENGFYRPDKPITYIEAYQAIAHALRSPIPSEESSEMLLEPYPDKDQLPAESLSLIAKLVNSRFFPIQGEQGSALKPNEAVNPEGLAPLINHLIAVTYLKYEVDFNRQEVVTLPAGLQLRVTPTSAIFQARLSVGDTVIFSLMEAASPLSRGSRLRGRVQAIENDAYLVELNEAQTPENINYKTLANLTLVFPPKDKTAFIVPGDVFEIITQIPADTSVSVPTNTGAPNFGPLLAPPAASSGSILEPNSGPRSSE